MIIFHTFTPRLVDVLTLAFKIHGERERERNESREHAGQSANGDVEPIDLTSPKSIYHVPVIDKHNCLLGFSRVRQKQIDDHARAHTHSQKDKQAKSMKTNLHLIRLTTSIWVQCVTRVPLT